MRTTNSVCTGICTDEAGVVGAAAEGSGVARRNTGLPSSPEVGGAEDDVDPESGARRSTGPLLLSDDDEGEEESLVEARRNVGRESSAGYDDPEDPELGYEPVSFGSGWRITGRGFADPDPEPDPELELEVEPESASALRSVGLPSSRGVSLRALV
jgi:hypothetical protein